MKKLIDYTKILRSKNAGPLFITFDLIFETKEDMDYGTNLVQTYKPIIQSKKVTSTIKKN